MTIKRPMWYWIAVGLSLVNLVGAGFAVGQAQLPHAAIHAALALAFGLWAQRLRPRRVDDEQATGEVRGGELRARLEALEGAVTQLRQELTEAQERLDFAERLLARGPNARRVGPER